MVFSRWLHSGRCSGNFLCSAALGRNKAPDVSNRYFREVSRIYAVLNKRLEGQHYMAGEEYRSPTWHSYPGSAPVRSSRSHRPAAWANPNLPRGWIACFARPAVQKGLTIPEPLPENCIWRPSSPQPWRPAPCTTPESTRFGLHRASSAAPDEIRDTMGAKS